MEQTRQIRTVPNKYVEPKKPKLRSRQDEIVAFRVWKLVIGEAGKREGMGCTEKTVCVPRVCAVEQEAVGVCLDQRHSIPRA